MRLVKRITAAAMALTMTAALAGCGSSSGSTSTTAAADTTAAAVTEKAADGSSAEAGSTSVSIDRAKEFVTVATGPTSGIYYPIGGAFATALGNAGYKTSAQATGASVENINLILNGEAELAIAMQDSVVQAYEGFGAFEKAEPDLRAMMRLWPNYVQLVTVASTGIKSVEDLKGKKVAMTWAYSPSYGKPLSVPQGVIGLMTRFGMDVVLAHPEGYEVMPEVEEVAKKNAEKTGGSFTKTNSMAEAFKDADIVYPKSWAPFAAMEKRTNLYAEGDTDGIKALEKELLAQNAEHKDWCCTEELMSTTKDGKALYLHCLPADINDVSCKDGEVEATVFDRYRTPLYKEASYKPYIIAAMILLAKQQCPQETLAKLAEKATERHMA